MLQKKPTAKLKDIISKDELLHLLGDGLKQLNNQEQPFNTKDKNTILIDATNKSPVASNNPIKTPNRSKAPKKLASKTASKIRSLKTLANKNTGKKTGNNNYAKKKPLSIVTDSTLKKKLVNKNVPIKKPAPMQLKQVLRESNDESTEADSSGKL